MTDYALQYAPSDGASLRTAIATEADARLHAALADAHRPELDTYLDMDSAARRDLCMTPLFRFWWMRLTSLRNRADDAATARWYDELGALMAATPVTTFADGAIEVDATHPWLADLLARMSASAPEQHYEPRQLEPLAGPNAALTRRCDRAMALIRSAWPALHTEICAHVRTLVPFSGDAFGWTNAMFLGAIFVNGARDHSDAFMVERIVHEASHTRLYTMMLAAPMHRTDHAVRVSSPVRRDLRPVSGVFHAAFVYARLIELMARAADAAPALRHRGADMVPVFDETTRRLRSIADLTDTGRAILDQMCAAVAAADLAPTTRIPS